MLIVVVLSMENYIDGIKLSITTHIRVQPIPGAKREGIQQNLNDPLHEDLETVVIYAETKNSVTDTPQNIVDKLIKLKSSIEELLPTYQVIISKWIVRRDNFMAGDYNRNANELIKTL